MATDETQLETPKQITKPKILDTGEVLQNHLCLSPDISGVLFYEIILWKLRIKKK